MRMWAALAILGGLIVQVFIPGFPKETLLLQSGISFGLFLGSLINWLGMVIGAQLGYEVARVSFVSGDKILKYGEKYLSSNWYEYLQERGNSGLFIMRLLPYAPNDVLSILSGSLLLPRRGFILVSLITALPYAIVFAYIGDLGSDILGQETVIVINLIVMVLIVTAFAVLRYLDRIKPKQENDNEAV